MHKHDLYELYKKYHADKAAGVKRGPLHTLKECYEEAGITASKFGKLRAKYPGMPKPRVATQSAASSRPIEYYVKKDVLAYIDTCLKAEAGQ